MNIDKMGNFIGFFHPFGHIFLVKNIIFLIKSLVLEKNSHTGNSV